MKRDTDLSKRMKKISKVFDLNKVLNTKIDSQYIKDYYSFSKWAYRFLYSRKDFIHMGISRDGKFKQSDLERTIDPVVEQVKEINAKDIFELACGRGANTEIVLENHKDKNYVFLDFSPVQIIDSIKRLSKYPNVKGFYSDFHQLDLIADNTFDIIFIVEALCHATDLKPIIKNLNRILRKGGRFIVIDAYYKNKFENLSLEDKQMSKLIEIGVAVDHFRDYAEFKTEVESNGLKFVKEEDQSQFILPSLYKIEFLARGFFKFKVLAKFIKLVFPSKMLFNAISGYLMALSIERGVAVYYTTIFEKE